MPNVVNHGSALVKCIFQEIMNGEHTFVYSNDEFSELIAGLEASERALRPGGKLAVVSFHSLEDRMVKRFMRNASSEPEQYRGMPTMPDELRPKLKTVGKVVVATPEETEINRRARSARLRIAERT